MRKFLLPIINLVNVILVSITFGLGSNSSVFETVRGTEEGKGNWYQLVWQLSTKSNVIGIVGFFLFVVAVALTVVVFFPFKGRKCVNALAGLMYIAAGVMFLLTPKFADVSIIEPKNSGSLIAMAVLVFIAGAAALAMAALEFTAKKAE